MTESSPYFYITLKILIFRLPPFSVQASLQPSPEGAETVKKAPCRSDGKALLSFSGKRGASCPFPFFLYHLPCQPRGTVFKGMPFLLAIMAVIPRPVNRILKEPAGKRRGLPPKKEGLGPTIHAGGRPIFHLGCHAALQHDRSAEQNGPINLKRF